MNTRAWIVFPGESGVSLLPQVRRTYAPRGRTPLLRHRLKRKRASMAAALGYHAADHLADIACATEQGIHPNNDNPQLPWSFLTHTGLTIHPPTPQN
ncbi:hypothetical protein [Streptomyces sp. TLI_105]|uniref:hypothetical protein n=1 Tax=Streptomyces sp. TLI_105 TaxID=1881019 RepID=UPI000A5BEEC0|nr:hypothetical protein [Streptomyces sp. TLI_105]